MVLLKQFFHTITIPPLFFFVAAFICGIVIQSTVTIELYYIALSLCILTIYLFYTKTLLSWHKSAILYLLAAIAGGTLYQNKIDQYFNFYHSIQGQSITIKGTIEDINETVVMHKKTLLVVVHASELMQQNNTTNVNKTFLIYMPHNNQLSVGDSVIFYNIQCSCIKNEHFHAYQMREGIDAIVFANKPRYNIVNRPCCSLNRFIAQTKQNLIASCKQALSPQTFVMFSSLFLGNRSYVKTSMHEINEHFKQWGIYHFLSRSGLHLALFIIIWNSIFEYLPLSFFLKQFLIVIITMMYGLFSWSSAPFIRSIMLFLFNKFCLISNHSYSLLHYLTLTCLCFVVYSPMYIFFLDFQLTFGITFVLAWHNQLYGQHLFQEYLPKKSNY